MSESTVSKENIDKAEQFKNDANEAFKSKYPATCNIIIIYSESL